MSLRLSLALLASCALTAACHKEDDSDDSVPPTSVPAASFDSSVAVAWFDELYDAIRQSTANSVAASARFSPPQASRAIAYSGITLYEAVVAGMPDHFSLRGQLNGLSSSSLPLVQSGQLYDWPSVANRAVSVVMADLFAAAGANGAPQVLVDIQALHDSFETQFQASLDTGVFQRSVDYGDDLAVAILAWASNDGFMNWNNCAYTPPVAPGAWAPTPGGSLNPVQPCWGNLRPFVLLYAAECAPLPPPPYSTLSTSAFYAEALEVRDVGDTLTAMQMDAANFWSDGGNAETGTPAGHWISIVGQVLTDPANSLDQLDIAAEAYARVGLAVADAFIGCWEMKYYYNLLRPVSYIRDAAAINDPTWSPFIVTPSFPEYTSGHSAQSGAAAAVLTWMLGNVAFTDDTHGLHTTTGFPARSFASFDEAADEAAMSRLYGGIDYRSGIERGLDQGRCIGQTIIGGVVFEP